MRWRLSISCKWYQCNTDPHFSLNQLVTKYDRGQNRSSGSIGGEKDFWVVGFDLAVRF